MSSITKFTNVSFVTVFVVVIESVGFAKECGLAALAEFKKLAQESHVSAPQIGESIVKKCPKERSEALQWTSFALFVSGQKDRARTIDRLIMPRPTASGVKRTIQMAEAGSYQKLQERLQNFHPSYKNDPKYRLVLGRAFARAGDFENAKKEIFTYLAKYPNDSSVRVEFLYLDIWAGKFTEANKALEQGLLESTQQDTKNQLIRGLELLKKNDSALSTVEPKSQIENVAVQANQTLSSPNLNNQEKKEVVVDDIKEKTTPKNIFNALIFSRWKTKYFKTNGVTFGAESAGLAPKVLFFEVNNTGFNEPKYQNFNLDVAYYKPLSDLLGVNTSIGWYSTGQASAILGLVGFEFKEKDLALKVAVEVERTALGLEEITLKQDAMIPREKIRSYIEWDEIVSWSAKLTRDNKVLTGESHEILGRGDFLKCETLQCAQVNVPIIIERYQVVSPYFYHDLDRVGYGLGFDSHKIFGVLGIGGKGNWKQWSATLPSGIIEDFATSELGLSLQYVQDTKNIKLEYVSRQTTSKYLFRNREVPSDLTLNVKAGF